jgi:hypothetical protein
MIGIYVTDPCVLTLGPRVQHHSLSLNDVGMIWCLGLGYEASFGPIFAAFLGASVVRCRSNN